MLAKPLSHMWIGTYSKGAGQGKHRVTITMAPGGLALELRDGSSLFWPFGDLNARRVKDGSLRLNRKKTAAAEYLLIGDPRAIQEIRTRAPGLLRMPLWRAAGRIALAVLVAASLAGVAWSIWGKGLAYDLALRFVPIEVEAKVGQAVLNRLAPPGLHCKDKAMSEAVQAIADRMVLASRLRDEAIRIVVTDEVSANTYSLPGGWLVLTRGMLVRTQTPEALAGVLAHEIAHQRHRHPLRTLFSRLASEGLLAAATGSTAGRLESLVSDLGILYYTSDQEQEIDTDVFDLLRAASIDAAPFVDFHGRLEDEMEGLPRATLYRSVHPSRDDRNARLRKLAGPSKPSSPPFYGASEWRILSLGCAAIGR